MWFHRTQAGTSHGECWVSNASVCLCVCVGIIVSCVSNVMLSVARSAPLPFESVCAARSASSGAHASAGVVLDEHAARLRNDILAVAMRRDVHGILHCVSSVVVLNDEVYLCEERDWSVYISRCDDCMCEYLYNDGGVVPTTAAQVVGVNNVSSLDSVEVKEAHLCGNSVHWGNASVPSRSIYRSSNHSWLVSGYDDGQWKMVELVFTLSNRVLYVHTSEARAYNISIEQHRYYAQNSTGADWKK